MGGTRKEKSYWKIKEMVDTQREIIVVSNL